jgi:molybdopterin synthase catalytic subunit
VNNPPAGDDWIALSSDALVVGPVHDWAVVPRCGGVVVFTGTVRDHAEGRDGVDHLTYEAYAEPAEVRMTELAADIRRRWPDTGRVALLHRVGRLELSEVAVIVAVSAPHRGEAFEACRYGIDTLKATVPIWKHEAWTDGVGWGSGAQQVRAVSDSVGPSA